MSGPKVVRVVTREEWEKRCKRAVSHLSKMIARMAIAASAAGERDVSVKGMSDQVIAKFNALRDASRFEEAESYAQMQAAGLEQKTNAYIEQAAIREQQLEQRKIRSRVQAQQWLNLDNGLPSDLCDDLKRISKGQPTNRTIDEVLSEAERILERQSVKTEHRLSESARTLATELTSGASAESYKHEEVYDAREQAVTKCLAELRLLNDSKYQSTSDEWVQCQAEQDTSRKRLLTDSLISKITQLLREAKQLSTLVDKANILETLLDESGISTATNLGQAVANRDHSAIQSWISHAEEALRQHEAAQALAVRRQTILSGLSELGYSVSEQMSVIWERDGRIVLERPQLVGYGVELSGRDNIQLRPVAFSDTRDKNRDRDVETIWCGDFTELRKQLSEDGNQLDVVRHLPIGAAPLAVVARKSQSIEADEEANLPGFREQ